MNAPRSKPIFHTAAGLLLQAAILCALAATARGQAAYASHLIFDNSLSPRTSFYSGGSSVEPARLLLVNGKLPLDPAVFRTPPNAIRLQWLSAPGGSWEAIVMVERWRDRSPDLDGDTLYFWCYAPAGIPAGMLPRVQLSDLDGGFSAAVPLRNVLPSGMPARRWIRAAIPLRSLGSISLTPFEPHRIASVHFLQSGPDSTERTLLVDEVLIDNSRAPEPAPLAAPTGLRARGYDRHIDLVWTPTPGPDVRRYVIYRSLDGKDFQPVGIQTPGFHRYADFLGASGRKAWYKVTASDRNYRESAPSPAAHAATRELTGAELLDMVEEACGRYYWEAAHPQAGLALENLPGDDNVVATGASGFGILALLVSTRREFISRHDAAGRLLRITAFLEKADRYHGAWSHFLDGRTGKTVPVFGKYENGGDLVETAFLVQGLLAARQFFDRDTPAEREIRARITRLWEGVEWDWYRRGPDGDFLFWHWSDDYTWQINHRLIGWNETMVTYLLAISSPTHPVPASLYYSGWASQSETAIRYRNGGPGRIDGDLYGNGNSLYGIKLAVGARQGGPLFFTHYSFLALNPRLLTDRYTNYFESNRNIALINLAYCLKNPHNFPGYGKQCWGLTASDGPRGYSANEPNPSGDDGTIAPTGALASMPYTPEESMAALKYYYRELGANLWDIYGFRDAFNLNENWYARIFMGLNQAPISVMIENYRTAFIWDLFMSNPEIRRLPERIRASSADAR